MKKNFKQFIGKSSFILAAFALIFGISAKAQTIENPTVLELGKEYTGKSFVDHFFVFTATETGKLIIEGNEFVNFYNDAAYQEPSESTNSYVSGGKESQKDVVAGQTYYLAIQLVFSDWHFIAKMGDSSSINLVSCTPEQNTYYDIAIGQLVLVFDGPVAYDKAILQAGTAAAEVSGMAYNKDLSFEIKDQLFAWLSQGIIKRDDNFTLKIEGVRSATNEDVKYNGDGILELTFICPGKPAEVVKEVVPEKFLSYWAPDAEDGIVMVEYDAELSTTSVPNATISFGSPEVEGDYYSESIPVIVDGKTLSMNLRGKKRIPSEMVISGTNYEFFQIRINNIKDKDENYVYSEGQGSFGSFQKQIPYEMLSVNLTTEFVPASGASLEGVTSVELWLSTDKAVAFEGIEVNFKKASGENACVIYTKEECNYKDEGEDGVILNIPINAEMQAGTNVTITLYKEQSLDGEERTIEAVYNYVKPFEPVTITPEPLTQVGDLSTITFTYDEAISLADDARAALLSGNGRTQICVVTMAVDGNNVVLTPELQDLEPGAYILNVPEGFILNSEGKKNEEMYLKYELIKVYGSGFNFEPEDGDIVTELSKITVINPDGIQISWNHDAYLYADDSTTPIATVFRNTSIEQVEPENFYDPITTVVLTLKDPENSATDVTITAPGTYRLEIPKGFFNIGDGYTTEDAPAMTITWTILDPNTLVFTPADGATVESLNQFIVDCKAGFGPSYNDERFAQVYDETGAVVAMVKKNETPSSYVDPETYLPTRVIMHLNNEITTNGNYTLKIDAGYFFVDGWNMVDSEAMELHFTVFNPAGGVEGIFGNEVDAYEVYNLNGVQVLTTPNADDLVKLPAGFYIINGKKVYLRK